MNSFQIEQLGLAELNSYECEQVDGGKGWGEIAFGAALIGVAIAVEAGSWGALSIPAGSIASIGAAAVLHGAQTL